MASNAISQILTRANVAPPGFLVAQDVTMEHFSMSVIHIGLVGFEPTASWSRTRRSTKLSHSPRFDEICQSDAPLTSRILAQIARNSRWTGYRQRKWFLPQKCR